MVALKSDVTVEDAINFNSWLHSISYGRTREELSFIKRACAVAQKAHHGQKRQSGEPYFLHPLAVANILAELRMDYETLAAAILHDVAEDTDVTLADIQAEFGLTVAKLVDGVTKMESIGEIHGQTKASRKAKEKAETFRKMMLAMVDDIRVILIKLADRTHNMRTLNFTKEEKRKRVARETMDIYAPLANRLGIWQIKWELEDRSFRYLETETYRQIAKMVDERRVTRERYIASVIKELQSEIKKRHIKADITGRPKHIYSIWKKMRRKGVDFAQIYDVRAVRVLVTELEDCYHVLGVVHAKWRPIPGEFDDYIAAPKDNMYRSLHTAVIGPEGKPLEIQIRTHQMHQDAEYGIAAHWRYKEGSRPNNAFDQKIAWLRQLMDWKDDVADADTFLDGVKTDVFQDRVHVFTPKGDIIDLPNGATPIDFAYRIHTEVGHRCRGAKINGRIVPLNYKLQNGDQVEVLTTKRGGPSRDWLNSHLGYLKSTRAKSKVRHWFKRVDYTENTSHGRAILEKELQRLGLMQTKYEDLSYHFGYPKVDDFLAAIGHGEVTPPQISSALKEIYEIIPIQLEEQYQLPITRRTNKKPRSTGSPIKIQGAGDMLTYLARCCAPVPGDDEIVGYITKGRGVSIHRKDCRNVLRFSEDCPERLIEVSWNASDEETYPVDIEVEAFDRSGLIRDIGTVVANEGISFSAAHVDTDRRKNYARIWATIDIKDIDQLSRVLTLIGQLPNVIKAQRRQGA